MSHLISSFMTLCVIPLSKALRLSTLSFHSSIYLSFFRLTPCHHLSLSLWVWANGQVNSERYDPKTTYEAAGAPLLVHLICCTLQFHSSNGPVVHVVSGLLRSTDSLAQPMRHRRLGTIWLTALGGHICPEGALPTDSDDLASCSWPAPQCSLCIVESTWTDYLFGFAPLAC